MLRHYLFFLMLIFFCFSCENNGKNSVVKLSTDEKTIETTYKQMMVRYDISMDSMRYYNQKLDSCYSENPKFIALKKLCKGTYLRKNGSFQLAISHYKNALEYLKPSDSLEHSAFLGLGVCYKSLGDFPTALDYFQKSIKVAETRKDNRRLGGTYTTMAQLYFEKEEEDEAKKYIDKVFELEKNNKTSKAYLIALHTLANIEAKSGNFQKAMELDKKGIELAKTDAAKVTFQDNMARCYLFYLKDYEKAEFYFNEILETDKKLNNPVWIADTYINLSEVETAKGNYPNAQKHLQNAVDISEKNKQFYSSLKAYSALSDMYKKQRNFEKALTAKDDFLEQYKKYFNEKSEQSFAEYNILYETEKKEKVIIETQLKSKQKNLWLILFGSLILIGLGIFRNYSIKSKLKQKQLALENELLQEQANAKMQEQRLEISRDLHDSIGSQLTFINSILDGIKSSSSKLDDKINTKINTLSDFSENSIAELKSVLWVLNSNEIHLQDLKSKLLNLIQNAGEAKENLKFRFDFDAKDNFQLNSKQAVNLFRVTQEIINNAMKYANANEIKISVKQSDEILFLQISDDGIGFDLEKSKNKSFGLTNIQNRISELGGKVNIETSEGNGTKYNIEIPL